LKKIPLGACSVRRFVGWLGVSLLLLSLSFLFFGRAPYVIDQPGPVFNVLGKTGGKQVITIQDAKSYPVSGQLDALTVQQVGQPGNEPSWFQVWLASMDASKSLVPMDEAYPTGVKTSQVFAEDAAMMEASQQDAQAAALNYLGIDFTSRVYVISMMTDSAATGLIKPGDFIDSVDGLQVADSSLLRERVQAWNGKKPLKVGVTSKGVSKVVEVTPTKIEDRFYIGVYVGYKYEFPFKIDVDLGDVGGPSAGSMFALGIIDRLTPGQMVGENHVAGTGTINPDGTVGPIGGIVQKMHAAKNAGATIFLAPSENCEDTVGKIPSGIRVYSIARLKTAVELLTAVKNQTNLSGFATCSK
jgi:PDZ domain-containing protein